MTEFNYFYCNFCKRYYLDVFRMYHDDKHKNMVFYGKKNDYNFDDTY